MANDAPPPPPAHRDPVTIDYSHTSSPHDLPQDPNNYSDYSLPPGVTPGVDHPSRTTPPHERGTPFSDSYAYDSPTPPRATYGSNASYAPSGLGPAGAWSSNSSQHSMPLSSPPSIASNTYPYTDSPYNRYSSSNLNLAPAMGQINPHEVADDDDWGMAPTQQKRRSFAPFGSASASRDGTPAGSASGSAALATGALAAGAASRDGSGNYDAVPGGDGNRPPLVREKSEWLDRQNHGKKKAMWIVISVIAFIVVGAIVGGVLGSVLHKQGGSGSDDSDGSSSASAVAADNKDDLELKSAEIQKLMNNDNLHKVFPGMDYTPLNSQYPDCLHVPPSQNNITRDMAVMSQLTNAVRLYGTDCNQTEMVLHSIDRLGLSDMKVWLGVWLGANQTTNDRQVAQMWDIIDKHGGDKFKGLIVGNEVLYRKDLNETALLNYITDIKQNLTDHNITLPIATSDLGDNWTADMATKVDIVMSNVHPFFAGVEVSKAAGWTWDFWNTHDVALTKSDKTIQQIIAEVGWPSGGGNDCGDSNCTSDTQGSIAGVDEMNQFMEDWICPSMANETEYFWFSAFDEPWKIMYNEKGKEWEDKWGLMDVNRNLKKGVTIPDCSGQTVS